MGSLAVRLETRLEVEPENVLPVQMARSAYRSPEHYLLATLIVDAVQVIARAACYKPPERPSDTAKAFYLRRYEWKVRGAAAAEARAWLFEEDGREPFSFEWCCMHLGLDPEWLREKILALDLGEVGTRKIIAF